MDPVNALGVAAATVQFVDFLAKLISRSHEIYISKSGELLEESHSRTIAEKLLELNSEIKGTRGQLVSKTDQEILNLCDNCDEIAKELLVALDKLKSGNKGSSPSKWTSFQHALLSIWRREDVQRLEQRLDDYRSQLVIHTLVSLREHQAQIGSQVKLIKNMTEENRKNGQRYLEYIGKNQEFKEEIIQEIRKDPKPSIIADRIDSERLRAEFENRILKALHFDRIANREQRICEAYEKTFEWIFQPPHTGQRPWTDFAWWLRSDSAQRLYWITGKAGAGKSTLMKFICNNEKTRGFLQQWASGLTLIEARFYFWNSGANLQMSHDGLLRTLLYQALKQYKGHANRSFPERWEMYTLLGIPAGAPMSRSDLQNGLNRLIKSSPQTRFAFFIDGLDEFTGDHAELVSFIQRLGNNTNVKFCVSSRPWVVFEDAFKRGPNLRLEDLTYPDIFQFVTSSFQESEGFTQLHTESPHSGNALIEEVAKKASGVFLWVNVVVRLLLAGLRDGERLQDLQRCLESLPPDLEDMFRKMLDSIGTERIEHTSQIFQIVRAARTPITLLCLSFADESDPMLASQYPIRPLSEEEEEAKSQRMRRRLNSYCKGLLEAKNGLHPSETTVEYLHRTAKDFLHRSDIWSMLTAKSQTSFNAKVALCRAYLLRLKCIRFSQRQWLKHDEVDEVSAEGSFREMLEWFIQYASDARAETGDAQLELFNELGSTTKALLDPKVNPGRICHTKGCWCLGAADHEDGPLLPLAVIFQILPYLETRLIKHVPMPQPDRTEARPLLKFALDYHIPQVLRSSVSGQLAWKNPELMVDQHGFAPALFRLLLKAGADPNLRRPTESPSPWASLIEIAEKGIATGHLVSPQSFELFLQYKADPRVDLGFLQDGGGQNRSLKRKGFFRSDLVIYESVLKQDRLLKKKLKWHRVGQHLARASGLWCRISTPSSPISSEKSSTNTRDE